MPLREGLYERLLTRRLLQALAQADGRLVAERAPLEDADSHTRLSRFLADEIERALRSVPGGTEAQARLANALLGFLRGLAKRADPDELTLPPEILSAVHRGRLPPRPETPLALSTLLSRPGQPDLGHEIAREIASADRVDALVSFVTWSGVRRIRWALEELAGAGRPLRLITTTYTGATELKAVRALAQLPHVEVKVSYDGRRSRLHAKAWLFHRESGYSTAYIGSANLSASALAGGLEWMLKATESDLRHVIEIFRGAFESLWEDPEFERFNPERDDDRLHQALRFARGGKSGESIAIPLFFSLKPYPFQQQILDDLHEQRGLLGRRRNLVVAATGTGKTMIAAFDYARQSPHPRLLFVAHRREILVQALSTFRHVLRDEAFGELLTGNDRPEGFDHLFATVQSLLNQGLIERLGAKHWGFVVVDECHHLRADSYRPIVDRLRPDVFLGLTATPERADQQSLLPDFDGHVAAEIRLWHAIDKQLVVPFEYYGIADGTDLTELRWTRGAYADVDLERIYTGNDRRAELIARKYIEMRGGRALGFCVSVRHAEFMAGRFSALGIPALAVHGDSPDGIRGSAPQRLRDGTVRALFTCDLYNEGVDLPYVDTLLLLRPTSSATVFLQQLGRGLRLADGKTSCLVLDFIGQHRKEFRFDRLLEALTGLPRGRLKQAVESDFPTLPSGCHLQLDRVAREIILDGLRQSLGGGIHRLSSELRAIGPVTLREFLEQTGREVKDVYRAGGWTTLRAAAGHQPAVSAGEATLSRAFGALSHLDDPDRIERLRRLAPPDRVLLMLGYQIFHRTQDCFRSAEWPDRLTPALREEAAQLADVLAARAHPQQPPPIRQSWPIALHRSYDRREVLTAVGYWSETTKRPFREGVLRLNQQRAEIFFVTLDKSEKRFSPTTRYDDYAISPTLFHWQSQSTTTDTSPTGRRYLEQAQNGWSFYLFVRPDVHAPYVALGPCHYVSHTGSRPMSITWRLEQPIPGALFERYATLLAA